MKQVVTQLRKILTIILLMSMMSLSSMAIADKEPVTPDTPENALIEDSISVEPDSGKTLKELITEEAISDKDKEMAKESKKPLQGQPEGPSLMQEGIKTIGMLLLLLVGFWWFSNWLKKSGRLARMSGSQGAIECLSVYSVGQKEKIALFRVKGEEILVGITQHSIHPLHHFSGSIEDKDDLSEKDFAKALDSAAQQ